VEMATVMSA